MMRVVAFLVAKWAQLHTWARDPDVEEMSDAEVYAGMILGLIVAFTLLFGLVFLLGIFLTTVL